MVGCALPVPPFHGRPTSQHAQASQETVADEVLLAAARKLEVKSKARESRYRASEEIVSHDGFVQADAPDAFDDDMRSQPPLSQTRGYRNPIHESSYAPTSENPSDIDSPRPEDRNRQGGAADVVHRDQMDKMIKEFKASLTAFITQEVTVASQALIAKYDVTI